MFLSSLVLLWLLLARMQDMGVVFHPGIPTTSWGEVLPVEQRPSLLVLDDLMRETVDSDGFTQLGGSSPQSLDCGHTKPV